MDPPAFLGLKSNWHFIKRNGLSIAFVIQYVLRIFMALQIFFYIYPLKWGIKWIRFWVQRMILNIFYAKLKNINLFPARRLFFKILQMVRVTVLFRSCLKYWKTRLKMTMLFRRCSTLYISTSMYVTLFQRWFYAVRHRGIIWSKEQRWSNVEIFAGRTTKAVKIFKLSVSCYKIISVNFFFEPPTPIKSLTFFFFHRIYF